MRFVLLLSLFVSLLVSATALAEPPYWESEATAETCAASFDERLADARQAVLAHQAYEAEHARIMPWFNEHCRWLSDLEIAIRKLDDPNAFVCDTAKGRPKGLTSDLVLEYQSPSGGISIFQKYARSNDVCERFDIVEHVSLVLRQPITEAERATREWALRNLTRQTEVMCYRVESKKCADARATVARFTPAPSAPPP